MATLADVTLWVTDTKSGDGGIAHIVTAFEAGPNNDKKWPQWTQRMCNSMVWGGRTLTQKPRRCCRKCIANLATFNVHCGV